MKTITILSSLFLVVLFAAMEVNGQSRFNLHAGASMPLSDYKSDDINDENAGGAGIGFTTGVQYSYQLTETGLGLFLGFDFMISGYQDDFKDEVTDLYESLLGLTSADYTWPKLYNLPLTGGLNILYDINEQVAFFANGGIAINFFKSSDFVIKTGYGTIRAKTDLANSIGFKIGGGIVINDKVSILVDYFGLGKHDLNSEVKITGSSPEKIDGEQKIDMINLSLGLYF